MYSVIYIYFIAVTSNVSLESYYFYYLSYRSMMHIVITCIVCHVLCSVAILLYTLKVSS